MPSLFMDEEACVTPNTQVFLESLPCIVLKVDVAME